MGCRRDRCDLRPSVVIAHSHVAFCTRCMTRSAGAATPADAARQRQNRAAVFESGGAGGGTERPAARIMRRDGNGRPCPPLCPLHPCPRRPRAAISSADATRTGGGMASLAPSSGAAARRSGVAACPACGGSCFIACPPAPGLAACCITQHERGRQDGDWSGCGLGQGTDTSAQFFIYI